MPDQRPSAYLFDGFCLDLTRGCLRGRDGLELALRRKSFETLRFMAENAGRLVSRSELMEAMWPEAIVTDDSITHCIADIRRAFGADGQRILKTVPGRGYLFAEQVTRGDAASARLSRDIAAGVPGMASEHMSGPPSLPLPERPSIVVLPFDNLSGDPEQDYFADGMTAELTSALTRVHWLFVIARNSAFTYKGKAVDVRQIGRELGVRYVLEGTVRRAGERVRIACQLVEAETGVYIWAEHFDSVLGDVFDLQDRLTETVAGALEPSLNQAEVQRVRQKPTDSLGAYDLYLRALPHHYAQTREGSDAALNLLREAIRLDPSFALAKAFAAYTMIMREVQGWIMPDEREEGAKLAREALSDAKDDATTLRLAGQAVSWLAHDREHGVAAIERALSLNPNSAQTNGGAGWTLLYVAQPDRAISLFQRAMRLSPLDPEISYFLSGLGYAYIMTGRYKEALAFGRRAVAEMPMRATGHRVVVVALHTLGRMEEAMHAGEYYMRMCPNGARVFASRIMGEFADPAFHHVMIAGLRGGGLPE
ncbi:winged helix-turn-helix domain-containing tetratricopeptide repeat protein [Roseomonas sp. GCM10028921]